MIQDEKSGAMRNALEALAKLGLELEFKGEREHQICEIKRPQSIKTGQLKLVIR